MNLRDRGINYILTPIVPGREYTIEPDLHLACHWMIMSRGPDASRRCRNEQPVLRRIHQQEESGEGSSRRNLQAGTGAVREQTVLGFTFSAAQ